MGIAPTPVDKPEALEIYQQIQEFHIPVVEGGIMDQPHIFMMEYAICKRVTTMMAISDAALSQGKGT